jgi:DNA polymerase III sliding clamp (beta) subunit (PCNA family)
MSINRQELTKTLELVAPALSESDIIPVLRHVLFTGTNVVAYNDRIAISIPLRTEFKGTAPGKRLIDLLKKGTHTESVDLIRDANCLSLRAERAIGRLESKPVEEFIFSMPARPRDAIQIDDKFLDAIDDCLQSTSEFSVTADHLGVTFIPDGSKQIKLFASKSSTMTHCKVDLALGLSERLILPIQFCRELLRLGRPAERRQLLLRRDSAQFIADDMMLFGKLLRSSTPFQFERILQRDYEGKKLIRLSKEQRPRLKVALDWASCICDIKGNEVKTRVKVHNNTMEFSSASNRGQVVDRIPIRHPNVDCLLQASLLRNVYDRYEDILITESCALMTRDNASGIFVTACYQP